MIDAKRIAMIDAKRIASDIMEMKVAMAEMVFKSPDVEEYVKLEAQLKRQAKLLSVAKRLARQGPHLPS